MNPHTVLLVIAFISFILAALKESRSEMNWIAIGLACWVATLLF